MQVRQVQRVMVVFGKQAGLSGLCHSDWMMARGSHLAQVVLHPAGCRTLEMFLTGMHSIVPGSSECSGPNVCCINAGSVT